MHEFSARQSTSSVAALPEGELVLPFTVRLSRVGIAVAMGLVVLALMAGPAFAGPAGQMTSLGPADPSQQITVTVWLNLHNKAAFDALVEGMYDPGSSNYHQFLTLKEYTAQFAPTADDVAAVTDFLASHSLTVTSVDKLNHYVIAQGTLGNAQAAFNTQINRTMVQGTVHLVNTPEASISEEAGALVLAVQGLNDVGYQNHALAAANPSTGAPYTGIPVSNSGPGSNGLFFTADCLRPPQFITFTTGGGLPSATYFGNRYGSDLGTPPPNLPSCGYDSAEIQTAYGLDKLYGQGLDGTGQFILIVDAFGSNTILADANLFSALNGLPALTPGTNFFIFTPNGSASCGAACLAGNWQFETTLDVEWAHSIAPGATIILFEGASNSFSDLDVSNLFAIELASENGLSSALSNSFGISEIALVDFLPSELVVENGISEIAAALGISQQVSTGDSGDNLALDNADFGINSVSVNANADSPFVTAVGGTSTFLDDKDHIKLQTGWGLNFTRIANPAPNPPTIPPLPFGFQEGAGGGTSVVYAKPRFQKHLHGDFRMLPDIAMNADPETGCEIIVTPNSVPGDSQFVEVFGGTSLSAPMFTGFWTIANQANQQAGGGLLGQAAPLLYRLDDPDAIIDVDVKPFQTLFNVSGVILNPPNPPMLETPDALAAPLDGTKFYISALFNSSSTRWDVFTFGTDSSLRTGPGWDNVTGLGTPNGRHFIKAVVEEANEPH